ncbi:MAG: glycosyltransferase family 4 protein [Elusimicrobiota bacterium]
MPNKIKILHIITRLDKGGSAENVLITFDKLNKNKYDTKLIFGRSAVSENTLKTIPNKRLDSLIRDISPIKDLTALFELYKIIETEKPDIIHTHSSKAGFLGRWAAFFVNHISNLKFRIKIVHTPHGHVFYGYSGKLKTFLFVFLERVSSIITDKLVALTEGEKKESLKFKVGKPENWEVIHSGIDLNTNPAQKNELKKKLNIPENTLVIGTVARLEPVKGIKYFAQAFPFIVKSLNRPITFVIVGDGNQRNEIESIVEKDGLKEKVIFTGMRADITDLMSIMDIYVQPSENEGMGKTIIQALYLGKPIIATNVQGIPDLIFDGKTGLLVPPKNAQAISIAVEQMANSMQTANKLGQQGKFYAQELVEGLPRFSTERMISLLEKMYDKIMARQG